MKKSHRILIILFVILAGLATVVFSIMKIAGNHPIMETAPITSSRNSIKKLQTLSGPVILLTSK